MANTRAIAADVVEQVPNLADLQRVYPSQSVNGSRSSSAMSSVLGNADIPVGSRFGDSRSHMEAAAPSLASLGLPSLSNGAADDAKLPDLSAPLPPLNDTGTVVLILPHILCILEKKTYWYCKESATHTYIYLAPINYYYQAFTYNPLL